MAMSRVPVKLRYSCVCVFGVVEGYWTNVRDVLNNTKVSEQRTVPAGVFPVATICTEGGEVGHKEGNYKLKRGSSGMGIK